MQTITVPLIPLISSVVFVVVTILIFAIFHIDRYHSKPSKRDVILTGTLAIAIASFVLSMRAR